MVCSTKNILRDSNTVPIEMARVSYYNSMGTSHLTNFLCFQVNPWIYAHAYLPRRRRLHTRWSCHGLSYSPSSYEALRHSSEAPSERSRTYGIVDASTRCAALKEPAHSCTQNLRRSAGILICESAI